MNEQKIMYVVMRGGLPIAVCEDKARAEKVRKMHDADDEGDDRYWIQDVRLVK